MARNAMYWEWCLIIEHDVSSKEAFKNAELKPPGRNEVANKMGFKKRKERIGNP